MRPEIIVRHTTSYHTKDPHVPDTGLPSAHTRRIVLLHTPDAYKPSNLEPIGILEFTSEQAYTTLCIDNKSKQRPELYANATQFKLPKQAKFICEAEQTIVYLPRNVQLLYDMTKGTPQEIDCDDFLAGFELPKHSRFYHIGNCTVTTLDETHKHNTEGGVDAQCETTQVFI